MAINSTSYNSLFISEQQLKDGSLINQNVDMKLLTPTIKFVQDIYLTRLLGTGLFVDLQDKIVAGTLNSNERFLLDAYISPYMIWKITQESYTLTTYKMMNKGVQIQNGDNSQAASISDLEALSDQAGSRADWYAERMIKFLIANANLFPTYRRINSYDDVMPTLRGFTSRLYLGGIYQRDLDNVPVGGSSGVSGSL